LSRAQPVEIAALRQANSATVLITTDRLVREGGWLQARLRRRTGPIREPDLLTLSRYPLSPHLRGTQKTTLGGASGAAERGVKPTEIADR
jgi:hypothetical protein